MREVSLGRLRVVEGTMADCSPGGSEGEGSAVELSSWPVSILGSLVDNLVKGREDVVAKLYLRDGSVTWHCQSDGKASDDLQQKIRFEMMKRKEFHITSALINGVRYLRVTIINKLTDENVLSSLLDKIEKLAEEFS